MMKRGLAQDGRAIALSSDQSTRLFASCRNHTTAGVGRPQLVPSRACSHPCHPPPRF
jgi:hypothetical protein